MWVKPKDQKVVGEVFQEARTRADLTQQELAKRLGKPQSFISAYEAGQRRIDVLEFLLIAGALDADPLSLFQGVIARRKADVTKAGGRKPASRLRLIRKVRF